MSVHYMKETLLARETHALLLKQALSAAHRKANLPSVPDPRPCPFHHRQQPLMAVPRQASHTHLTLQLDSSQIWWCLQDQKRRPSQKERGGSPDGPTPAQLSYVLLKLREEIPAFFNGHHSYDLYDPHMLFENQLWRYPWEGRGLLSYKLFLQCSRATLRGVASGLRVDLIRITKDSEDGRIDARWRIKGRHHWSRKERVFLDGMSSFTVAPTGLISSHKLSRLEPPRKHTLLNRLSSWLPLERKLPQPEI